MNPLDMLLSVGKNAMQPGQTQGLTQASRGLEMLMQQNQQQMPAIQAPARGSAIRNLFQKPQATQTRTGITPRASAKLLQAMAGRRNAAL